MLLKLVPRNMCGCEQVKEWGGWGVGDREGHGVGRVGRVLQAQKDLGKWPVNQSELGFLLYANEHFSSVQFGHSVVSDSATPWITQHARAPCPSPNSGVHSNSCPSSQWCHPAISSSVVPFSSCPQSLPASGSFPMSQLFAWGGQSTGVSALASVLNVY